MNKFFKMAPLASDWIKMASIRQFFCLLALLALTLPACAAQHGRDAGVPAKTATAPAGGNSLAKASKIAADSASWTNLAPVWRNLATRLAKDGVNGPKVMELLESLPPTYTQSPMGRKMKELYRRQFMRQPKPAKPREEYYRGVVTQGNARLCSDYIKEHEAWFHKAWEKYGVPPRIAASLLFVETRLGKVLGDVPENAFYTLASMSVCDRPDDISQWLSSMPGYQKHLPWMLETMRKRSDWAYKETRALIEHMIRDNLPPSRVPGSIYGAVGLCQFMPSNISAYGADGDGDGQVDLFSVPDAIASLSNYLAKHGWKPGLSREGQHKVLMSYNHAAIYANTILALSDLVGENRVTQTAQENAK